ncbi:MULTISPECIES: bifunctional UDP-N-acetylglucosamine diphosphorylase/glucosamine-1-phosphate N-acetyltransferase GlmU [unclassified Sedimentibacter]|uniref:bifunctional UDP-N-acetylglucosamine diphosphorylase/glucosamine-1-phosphate N-acetyltransferase GlmU n=1 Tax=unclassified Sedimentibacter TaxID=2649220 RepID=UPI0027E0486B|nr:bifunctional UDP-N-acetylglucosamine diphosphorylase/glucosamine-1-phosphate N-acetyltransferase GlmU [Sedimentibacter sp. MB35-C1]WMJ76474.1 bifunctional UDP-N-acetylglucosamine diphosphorylase/glucosamine-1-phosphate N-acetyltransferase GlmU [Sedimentibacter sp. MB35-C1]
MGMSIILAAGEGTRMKSNIPKTLHKVCGKEMIRYVVDAAKNSGIEKNVVVLGHGKEKVGHNIEDMNVVTVEQPIGEGAPYGTGFAVMSAVEYIDDDDTVVILVGDGPLIRSETLVSFMKYHEDNGYAASVMTSHLENPKGYGRIVRNNDLSIMNIVEEKDASEEIKKINEINTGIYCFSGNMLKSALQKIDTNNSQGEYYLTDTIKVLNTEGHKIGGWLLEHSTDIKAVNDRVQLAEVNKIMQERINKKLMLSGVSFIDPEHTYIADTVKIGADTVVYPGSMLEGSTVIGSNCTIGPNARIIDSALKNNVTVESSKVIESIIDEGSTVGPFAYLRPGTVLGKNVKIGDFVEVKKSTIGDNSKSSHLSYIGDATVGKNVNIGCGVVFVNYDGKSKHQTIVGDGAFVGSNSNLVAPVTVQQGGYVACGSTITDDVEEGDLAIARARQVNKKGLGKNRY